MTPRRITVSRAAQRAGLTAKAVRLYESKGLLAPTARTESGYRIYSERDVEMLRFIRQARTLGLSLEEIRDLIDLQRQGAQPCNKVLQVVEAHMLEIDRTMADLRTLRNTLAGIRHQAAAGGGRDGAVVCGFIESAGEVASVKADAAADGAGR
jgi:MerR family copper efflux transcriptional regulator